MAKIGFVLCLLFIVSHCFAQSDTLTVRKAQGLLFLTAYNNQYDWNESVGKIRILGFHDYFFPCSVTDVAMLSDSNLNVIFKNGFRVDYIENRKPLKKRAAVFTGKDTCLCYSYDTFFVLPVTIDYKLFKDYWPASCRKYFYEIQVTNGSRLKFEYLDKAILPFAISPHKPVVKKTTK